MSYSLDFRKKVLAIKEQEGLTRKEASVRFGIGIYTSYPKKVLAVLCKTARYSGE
jgi:transposase